MAATDGTLVQGALSGDGAAFAELYDRHDGLIRAVCYEGTHDFETAAELSQEVFLRAMQKLGALRDRQRFAGWLVGIARHVCREWRRGRVRIRRVQAELPDELPATAEQERGDERVMLLRDALAALPERERLALQAFYLSGLNAEQARAVLGLTRPTFYRVLAQARERLAKVLRAQEVRP